MNQKKTKVMEMLFPKPPKTYMRVRESRIGIETYFDGEGIAAMNDINKAQVKAILEQALLKVLPPDIAGIQYLSEEDMYGNQQGENQGSRQAPAVVAEDIQQPVQGVQDQNGQSGKRSKAKRN